MLVATATPPAFEGVYNALVRSEESGALVAHFLLVFDRIDLDGIVPDVINYSHDCVFDRLDSSVGELGCKQ